MAITMDSLPAAEGGFKVTREMIEQWCAAYDAGELPDGYAFDGPIKPGRPKLANEATSSLSFKCPASGADMMAVRVEARPWCPYSVTASLIWVARSADPVSS